MYVFIPHDSTPILEFGEAYPSVSYLCIHDMPNPSMTPQDQLVKIGIEKCMEGKFEEAIQTFNQAAHLGMTEDLLYNRTKAHLKLGRFEESLADINALIKLQPKNAQWVSERAILHQAMKNKSAALADLDEAVLMDPSNPFRYSSRAFIKDYYRDHIGAIQDYERAIALDPEDAISHNNKGLVEEKLGHLENSKKSFTQADKLDKFSKGSINSSSILGSQPPTSKKIEIPAAQNSSEKKKNNPTRKRITALYFIHTTRNILTSKAGLNAFINFLFGKKN